MSVENKQVRGDASVSRNVNAGGNARVQGNMHVGHNLRVDGAIEAQNIKAANKGLFISESELNRAYPNPQDGWFAGVGETSPFTVYIANGGVWQRTNGTFAVDVDMSRYNGRIDELESQLESNNALIAELIEIIREGGGSADLVMITIENDNPTWGSVSGGGLKRKGSVTLTATAESGYHFVEWQDAEGNTIAGAGATYTFDATESVTLKAVFAVSYYTVTAAPNNSTLGSVSVRPAVPAGQSGYTYGTLLTLTATASDIHMPPVYFVRWSDEASGRESGNERVFDIHNNIQTTAMFEEMAQLIADVELGSAGRGSVGISVTRNNTPIAPISGNYYVMPGDVIVITATEDGHDFEQWVDGNGNPITGAGSTISFTYDGTQSLEFHAEFDEQAQVVSRTVSVEVKNGQSSWGSAEIVLDGESKSSVTVAENTEVLLRATANNGYAFAHWKNGVETLDWTAEKTLAVTESTAGTYTAEFEHNTAPDFYFGAVNTPNVGEYAADYTGLSSMLASGYLVDNNEAIISGITFGKTFIYLYDAEKVTPTRVRVIPVGYDQYASNFTGEEIFDTATFHIKNNVVINGTTYTAIELLNGNESEGSEMRAEITFTANNNS